MLKSIALSILCLAISASVLLAQQTTVAFDSGSSTMFNSNGTTPLTGGSTTDGNGAVLQLGYYTLGTNANPFAGTFVALSGQGSANTALIPGGPSVNPDNEHYNQTSIGDNNVQGAGDGTFFLSLDFVAGNAMSGNNLPGSTTIPLCIAFYNGTTIANSTFFNVASGPGNIWDWKTPSVPPSNVAISLDDPNLVWLGGANSAFRTSISLAVPEPSTLASLILGASGLALVVTRRRGKQ